MKRMLSFLVLPLCTTLSLLITKQVDATTSVEALTKADDITCYTSYIIGGSWTLVDCLDCPETVDDVRRFSGKSTCTSY